MVEGALEGEGALRGHNEIEENFVVNFTQQLLILKMMRDRWVFRCNDKKESKL